MNTTITVSFGSRDKYIYIPTNDDNGDDDDNDDDVDVYDDDDGDDSMDDVLFIIDLLISVSTIKCISCICCIIRCSLNFIFIIVFQFSLSFFSCFNINLCLKHYSAVLLCIQLWV